MFFGQLTSSFPMLPVLKGVMCKTLSLICRLLNTDALSWRGPAEHEPKTQKNKLKTWE